MHGIKPGWWRRDMNVAFPDVQAPWTGGAFDPTATNGTSKYVLSGGNWELSGDLVIASPENMYVKQGVNNLWVKGNVDIKGTIKIETNATLNLYIGTTNGSVTV